MTKVLIKARPLFEVRTRIQLATGAEFTGTARIKAPTINDVMDKAPDDLGLNGPDHDHISKLLDNNPNAVRLLEITVEQMS